MSCQSCSENSSTTYSRCNPPISTNCTFYQGENLKCSHDEGFAICKGQNMSAVQEEIFNRICQLIGDTDVSKVVIPCELEVAWNEQDKTILNLFNYVLQVQCAQKASIAALTIDTDHLNPFVTVCLSCCTPNGDCNSSATIRLSDALQEIITCLCNAKAEIKQLQTNLATVEADLSVVKSTYTQFSEFITMQTTLNVQNAIKFVSIEAKTNCLNDCP